MRKISLFVSSLLIGFTILSSCNNSNNSKTNEVIDKPHISNNNSIAGYIVILAENLDEATKIAKKCPILNGQNTSVEIRETAIPG